MLKEGKTWAWTFGVLFVFGYIVPAFYTGRWNPYSKA